MKATPIQNRRGRFLTSTETIDDQLEEERSLPGYHRPVASRIHNQIHRARGKTGGIGAKDLAKRLLPHVGGNFYKAPSSRGPALRSAGRRCMVKASYVKNRMPGQWQAHARYLGREGAQQDGEKGRGFDRNEGDVNLAVRLNAWQEENDPHLFKVILSPEDPLSPDGLRDLTRRFNERIARQIGRDYDWVAIDHHNTSHPHVHLLIRGKGRLELAPDMIRRGMREAAQEILTERLGYRTEKEIQAARERDIDQRRFTALDREILGKAAEAARGYSVVDEAPPASFIQHDADGRRRRIARLEKLVVIGVADKIGPNLWRLEPGWDKALRELQMLQTRTEMIAQARALMTEPRCPPQVTKIRKGERLVGRVLGTGLDEQYDRSYLLIEGVDNRAHVVYQTAGMEKARAREELGLRHLVALSGLDRGVVVKDYGVEIPDQGWKQVEIPDAALDDQIRHERKHAPKEMLAPLTGFAAEWHRRLLERRKQKEKDREQQTQQKKQTRERKTTRRERGSEIE
ncbi:MAG: DUF3363 domain-containing protein [Acidithiobacillus sp.]